MTRRSQLFGISPDPQDAEPADDAGPALPAADPVGEVEYDSDAPLPRDWGRLTITLLCAAAAVAWLGFVAVLTIPAWLATPPTPAGIANLIAMASTPLAVIGVIYALTTRNSRAEARRFAETSAGLRAEKAWLEQSLARLSAGLAQERASLAETSDALLALGEDATHRMRDTSTAMRTEIEAVARHAQALKQSASAARADVAVLLGDLPKAQIETRDMVVSLERAGLAAHEQAGRLDAQLASLTARGREADEIAGGAAQKLAAHLARVEGVSATAGARLTEAAATMTNAIDTALDHAASAGDAARQGMEAQGAAMRALVDQSQAALARTGADSAQAVAAHIAEANERVEAMAALLAIQSETTAQLLAGLRDGLDHLDGRFAALDETGTARSGRLTATLAALADHADTLTSALERGTGTADALIGRTETLMTALDATTREIDDTLPAAYDRLDARAEASQAVVARSTPDVAAIERSAAAALDRLMEAEALLAKQRAMVDEFAEHSGTRLASGSDAARALLSEIEKIDGAARDLTESASSHLVDALLRVRETAQTAAERAREAIERVIPEAAEKLSEASREALARTISEQVERHIGDLKTTAERALEAAHTASDRLMRQMLTIADTSATVEARITEAKVDAETSDRDNFARRVALLIESLNSTAIDVTKILSNDVTDSAWAAYLRGDRGVFTRRAVRLLTTGEVREIVRHYENETEFREQVNRYIHDFEAMLRNVLATRDGSALSVTLLSSDMGKLYVALAQAIERLRA